MTPQEKAKDLLDKLSVLQEKIEWGNSKLKTEAGLIYEKNNIEYNEYYDELAKQSALIAVDEVIKALEEHKWQNRHIIDEYEQLKKEINERV